MASHVEASYVALFAGLLGAGAVVALSIPVLRHAHDTAVTRRGLLALVLATLLVAFAAAALLGVAAADPAVVVPVVAVTAGLRVGSPALLYWRVREASVAGRGWGGLRALLAVVFLGIAGLLVAERSGAFTEPASVAVLGSDRLLMALGASALFVRFALRARPRDATEWRPVWIAAILLGVAFLLVAPYAFPGFAEMYFVSGIAGWLAGAAVAVLDR
ncbi:MAG: hypothetical protein ACT4OI_10415 [Methanobacteriota archaeon]